MTKYYKQNKWPFFCQKWIISISGTNFTKSEGRVRFGQFKKTILSTSRKDAIIVQGIFAKIGPDLELRGGGSDFFTSW